MAIVNPSSAVIAKAKAKYGRRLSERDYAALVKCETVSDVVRYLKTYTYYRNYLNKVGSDIHRGSLENILRKMLFDSFLELCRYVRSDSPVTGYILRQTEIRELMKYLTLLSIGRPQDYIFSLPIFFDDHTELPLAKLSGAHSYIALTELLEPHGYRETLEKHIPEKGEKINLPAIEHDMEVNSFIELYNDIGKIKRRSDKTRLSALFDTLCDYQNFSRIMRLKRYYNMSNADIKEYLLPFGNLTGRRLDITLAKESYDDVMDALSGTRVGKKAKSIDVDVEMGIKGKFEKCRHEMYFSTDPEIVLLAYYIVKETELKNIITVIEGVRYSMDSKSIYDILIM